MKSKRWISFSIIYTIVLSGCSMNTTPGAIFEASQAHRQEATEVGPEILPPRKNESVGVEIPVMTSQFSGQTASQTYNDYFSPAVMSDIKNNLGADYVRTEWLPTNVMSESPRWADEDTIITNACQAGLGMLIIIPTPEYDPAGLSDYYSMVSEFFERYQRSQPGCIKWYEFTNEPDKDTYWGPVDSASAADKYASYYEQIESIFVNDDISASLFTGGTSGSQLTWNMELYGDLSRVSAYVGSYGYHPYDVPTPVTSSGLPKKITALEQVVGSKPIALTEVGFSTPTDEATLIESSPNCAYGVLTIYEYRSQPNDGGNTTLGLVDNPYLYNAVKNAFASIKSYSCPR